MPVQKICASHFDNEAFALHLRRRVVSDKIGVSRTEVVGCSDTAGKRADKAGRATHKSCEGIA